MSLRRKSINVDDKKIRSVKILYRVGSHFCRSQFAQSEIAQHGYRLARSYLIVSQLSGLSVTK